MTRYASLTGGLLAGITLVVPAVVHAQAPDLASAKARTVQVNTTVWGVLPYRQGEQPKPIQVVSTTLVQYDRSGKAHIQELTRNTPAPNNKPSLLVNDGKTQYELIGSQNKYLKAEATPAENGIQSRVGLAGSALALALGWKSGMIEKYSPAPDDTVDGKKLWVFAREYSVKSGEKQYTINQKFWVDPATHLPTRFSSYMKDGDTVTETSRTEFAGWKLDEPLDDALFAWNPPAGVTEYKAPERPPLLTVGVAAPDFTVAKWGGGDLKLSDYRGKVVVLDFWATWCGPCQMSMPHVETVFQRTKDKDIAVLGVCVWDEKDAYDKWMPKNQSKYGFTFGFDPAGRGAENVAKKLYQVSGIPTTYVIDREGKVAAAIVGYQPDDTRIEEALGKLGITVPKGTKTAKR